jgi:hypothetical protein
MVSLFFSFYGWHNFVEAVLTVACTEYSAPHRVYFCPVVRIGSPHPLTRKRVLLPPLDPRRETHLIAGEGVGEPNSDEGTDTPVLCVYNNPPKIHHPMCHKKIADLYGHPQHTLPLYHRQSADYAQPHSL